MFCNNILHIFSILLLIINIDGQTPSNLNVVASQNSGTYYYAGKCSSIDFWTNAKSDQRFLYKNSDGIWVIGQYIHYGTKYAQCTKTNLNDCKSSNGDQIDITPISNMNDIDIDIDININNNNNDNINYMEEPNKFDLNADFDWSPTDKEIFLTAYASTGIYQFSGFCDGGYVWSNNKIDSRFLYFTTKLQWVIGRWAYYGGYFAICNKVNYMECTDNDNDAITITPLPKSVSNKLFFYYAPQIKLYDTRCYPVNIDDYYNNIYKNKGYNQPYSVPVDNNKQYCDNNKDNKIKTSQLIFNYKECNANGKYSLRLYFLWIFPMQYGPTTGCNELGVLSSFDREYIVIDLLSKTNKPLLDVSNNIATDYVIDSVIYYTVGGYYTLKKNEFQVFKENNQPHIVIYSGYNYHGNWHSNGGNRCEAFIPWGNDGRESDKSYITWNTWHGKQIERTIYEATGKILYDSTLITSNPIWFNSNDNFWSGIPDKQCSMKACTTTKEFGSYINADCKFSSCLKGDNSIASLGYKDSTGYLKICCQNPITNKKYYKGFTIPIDWDNTNVADVSDADTQTFCLSTTMVDIDSHNFNVLQHWISFNNNYYNQYYYYGGLLIFFVVSIGLMAWNKWICVKRDDEYDNYVNI